MYLIVYWAYLTTQFKLGLVYKKKKKNTHTHTHTHTHTNKKMTTTQKENEQPISIIFDGHNYTRWATTMRSYLKGMKLWLVVTGE